MRNRVIKVLLIDDDKHDFVITRQLLSRIPESSFRLDWVASYEEGLEKVTADEYDVYLVDYMLGPKTGLDLIGEAVKLDSKRPMIVLTAHGNHELDKEAIQVGAADYLPKKELSPTLLERSIRHAIERHQFLEKLYYQATHDELTALYNRKYIMEQLTSLMSGSHRHGFSLCFCLCDIDYFKSINDKHGHNAGDEVLSAFGGILREELRLEDVPGRYGGDEFCIVFSHVTADGARKITERIRSKFINMPFRSEAGEAFQVTATFGISGLTDETDPKDLIAAADQALYQAKEMGRNRTAVLNDPRTPNHA